MSETQDQTQSTSAATGSATLVDGLGGVIGIKAGMTQVFNEQGESLAVTVIDLPKAVVTQLKTMEKDGYRAVQIGVHPKSPKNATKSESGHAKASGGSLYYHYQEIRMPVDAKLEGVALGAVLTAGFLKDGDMVDLTSVSKGKGFQGVMKRYNYAGGYKTHGASVCHRSLGSIGNRADPGRVFKNKKMAGQMGNVKTTVQNLRVVKVDLENGVVLVHGSVPGPRSGLVTIRKSVKFAARNK